MNLRRRWWISCLQATEDHWWSLKQQSSEAKSFEQAHPDHREPSRYLAAQSNTHPNGVLAKSQDFANEPSKPHDGPPCPFGRYISSD